jgi:hypothetical protein
VRRRWCETQTDLASLRLSLHLSDAYIKFAFEHFFLFAHSQVRPCRKRNDWEHWEPMYEILTDKEVEALDAKDERDAR